jgi:sugar phosphate isomerase/epimerase
MRIGFLCSYTKEDLALAKQCGFGSVELIVGHGAPLDPAVTKKDAILRAKDDFAKRGLEVSAVGNYQNNLSPKPAERERNAKHLENLLRLCELMGVNTLCTFAGRDPEKDLPDNIPMFKKVFAPLAQKAADKGLRIAFENCPMFDSFPFRGINIAYCPKAWDLMFDAVPTDNLGLEYDASHLICMLQDYLEVIYRYGERIFHVHAKDAEVVWRECKVNGILEHGAVRHRTPGMGQADWKQIVSALREVGYNGNLDIEGRHDPIYRGASEAEGLIIARKHLEQFIG